jgi:hypothetical protein
VTKVRASSGHHFTHCGPSGWSLQLLHVNTTFFTGCIIIAPNSQALMHHAQPLHACSSTVIVPSSSWCRASLGQAVTHAGSSQCRHVTARLLSGPKRRARILDFVGLNVFSLVIEQAYSQTQQPMHFSGSEVTNFLS